ncbi:phosphoglucomutase-like protein 2-like 1 [Blastocladiella britannica]|nr:phosphoglucomutase-like protein 2-like 1 [Blastocladiella britannica]
MSSSPDVYALAAEWLRLDRTPSTRAEIEALVAAKNEPELARRLGSRIEFGTAGLRAAMEAGFSRMNDLTVIQATQGLAAYLLSTKGGDASQCSVVIGHDHRACNHLTSVRFARLTAAVFLHRGIKVYYYPNLVHTPMVPFGITHLGASCGIMITASHNPKADNGYKLYWGNGAQIIPPMDSAIAATIEQNLEPWVWDETLVDTHPLVVDPTGETVAAYMAAVAKLGETVRQRNPLASGIRICYTAMHGVGFPFMRTAFDTAGLSPFFVTPEQVHPDPAFPTVAFPNPEEGKGALALAMAAANEHNCSVILANDPDADRLAVAERQPDGAWHVFSGNQIGIILAAFMLPGFQRAYPGEKLGCLTTTVSSMMIREFARVEGIHFEETLTGFKYLGNCGLRMVERGQADRVYFAFEQAIGFASLVGDGKSVLDKDGVSAAVAMAELAHWLATRNPGHPETLFSYLQSLYVKYGYFASNDGYVLEPVKTRVDAMFTKIRPQAALDANENWATVLSGTTPAPTYPTAIGDFAVTAVRDVTAGWDSTTADHRPVLPTSRAAHMITFTLTVPDRLHASNVALKTVSLTLRTSGTEPKVKWYSELSGLWTGDADVADSVKVDAVKVAAEKALEEVVAVVKSQWLTLA